MNAAGDWSRPNRAFESQLAAAGIKPDEAIVKYMPGAILAAGGAGVRWPLPKKVLAYTGGPGDDFEPGQRLIFDAEATELKEIPNSPIAILRVRRGEARRDRYDGSQ